MAEKSWLVYLLRCADATLYCGVTNDLSRRLRQHNGELKGGAKYTLTRRPCELVYQESCADKRTAMKREYDIKKFSRDRKEQLLKVGV